METQKIVNLLNGSDNDFINEQNNGQYDEGSVNDLTIKFETKTIISSLCDYSDAYILVTGNILLQELMQILKLHLKIVLLLEDV